MTMPATPEQLPAARKAIQQLIDCDEIDPKLIAAAKQYTLSYHLGAARDIFTELEKVSAEQKEVNADIRVLKEGYISEAKQEAAISNSKNTTDKIQKTVSYLISKLHSFKTVLQQVYNIATKIIIDDKNKEFLKELVTWQRIYKLRDDNDWIESKILINGGMWLVTKGFTATTIIQANALAAEILVCRIKLAELTRCAADEKHCKSLDIKATEDEWLAYSKVLNKHPDLDLEAKAENMADANAKYKIIKALLTSDVHNSWERSEDKLKLLPKLQTALLGRFYELKLQREQREYLTEKIKFLAVQWQKLTGISPVHPGNAPTCRA
jgi:hypothetical protein